MTQIPLQSRFKQDFTRIRTSGGSYVDGRYVEGTLTATDFKGSVQPFIDRGSETLQRLAEGDRTKKVIVIYTYPDTLKTVDEKNNKKADIVLYEGETYEIQKVNRWKGQILTHDEVWGVEIDAGVIVPGVDIEAVVETETDNQSVDVVVGLSMSTTVSSETPVQSDDSVANVYMEAAVESDNAIQDSDVVGAFDSITINKIGTGSGSIHGSALSISASLIPSTVSGQSRLVFADSVTDQVRTYSYDVGTGAVTTFGSALSYTNANIEIVPLAADRVAAIHSTSAVSNGIIRELLHNGSTWGMTGINYSMADVFEAQDSACAIGGSGSIIHVGINSGASSNYFGDYTKGVTTWSRSIAAPGIAGIYKTFPYWAGSGSGGICVYTAPSGVDQIRCYSGAPSYVQQGNSLLLGYTPSAFSAMGSSRIVVREQGTDIYHFYDWNGTDFTEVGSGYSLPSPGTGHGTICGIDANYLAVVFNTSSEIIIYNFTG